MLKEKSWKTSDFLKKMEILKVEINCCYLLVPSQWEEHVLILQHSGGACYMTGVAE